MDMHRILQLSLSWLDAVDAVVMAANILNLCVRIIGIRPREVRSEFSVRARMYFEHPHENLNIFIFFQYLCLFENKSLTVTFLKMHIKCLTNYKRQDISIDRERSYAAIF